MPKQTMARLPETTIAVNYKVNIIWKNSAVDIQVRILEAVIIKLLN